jgi:hypothetical protein
VEPAAASLDVPVAGEGDIPDTALDALGGDTVDTVTVGGLVCNKIMCGFRYVAGSVGGRMHWPKVRAISTCVCVCVLASCVGVVSLLLLCAWCVCASL